MANAWLPRASQTGPLWPIHRRPRHRGWSAAPDPWSPSKRWRHHAPDTHWIDLGAARRGRSIHLVLRPGRHTSTARAWSVPSASQPDQQRPQRDAKPVPASSSATLKALMPVVQITEATPREAVRWWSKATGIPVVIDWSELARNWPEPPARINLELRQVEALHGAAAGHRPDRKPVTPYHRDDRVVCEAADPAAGQ